MVCAVSWLEKLKSEIIALTFDFPLLVLDRVCLICLVSLKVEARMKFSEKPLPPAG